MNTSRPVSPIQSVLDRVQIRVHAQPGAKKTEVVGLHGDAIKIRIQAPPLEGRANEELARFLAETIGLSRSQVNLLRGDKSRAKVFEVSGASIDLVRKLLLK